MDHEIIYTMPHMFGEQLYPAGFPVKPEQITVNGKTVTQRYCNVATIVQEQDQADPEDIEVVKDYIRYFLLAPIWVIQEDHLKQLTYLDYNELYNLCDEYGLNPF